MKKYLSYGLLFLVIYLVFVVSMIPASWIVSKVELPASIQVQGITGTVWNANVSSLHIDKQVVSDVKLSMNTSSLLLFSPSVDIEFGSALVAGPEGKLTVNNLFGDIEVANAEVLLSASMISEQISLPVALKANNYITLTLENFTVGTPVCQQTVGNIRWDKASVTAFEQTVSLGKLAASLDCQDGQLVMTIAPDNDLGLTFAAYLGEGNRLTGQGYIKPGAKFPQQLKELLPFIGRKDNQGRYAIRL